MGRNSLKSYRIWFITGSQHLYGEETLKQVAEHSRRIVDSLNGSGEIALDIVWKPTRQNPGGGHRDAPGR